MKGHVLYNLYQIDFAARSNVTHLHTTSLWSFSAVFPGFFPIALFASMSISAWNYQLFDLNSGSTMISSEKPFLFSVETLPLGFPSPLLSCSFWRHSPWCLCALKLLVSSDASFSSQLRPHCIKDFLHITFIFHFLYELSSPWWALKNDLFHPLGRRNRSLSTHCVASLRGILCIHCSVKILVRIFSSFRWDSSLWIRNGGHMKDLQNRSSFGIIFWMIKKIPFPFLLAFSNLNWGKPLALSLRRKEKHKLENLWWLKCF